MKNTAHTEISFKPSIFQCDEFALTNLKLVQSLCGEIIYLHKEFLIMWIAIEMAGFRRCKITEHSSKYDQTFRQQYLKNSHWNFNFTSRNFFALFCTITYFLIWMFLRRHCLPCLPVQKFPKSACMIDYLGLTFTSLCVSLDFSGNHQQMCFLIYYRTF